jgi:predicted outer membrane repeat protein
MLSNRPKYLKAVLFTNNLAEVGGSVIQSQCFTVQDYHYHCYRERDSQGNLYGGILSEYLDFTVVVADMEACKFFFQQMEQNENTPVSFLFNATFGPTGRMTDYEDGLVTYGYVIDVEESCDNDDITGHEQVLIHVRMQLSNMYFLGSNAVHYLEITKD